VFFVMVNDMVIREALLIVIYRHSQAYNKM
jgi:hypothetical protein